MIVTRILLQTRKDDSNRALEAKDLTVGESLKILKTSPKTSEFANKLATVFFPSFAVIFK